MIFWGGILGKPERSGLAVEGLELKPSHGNLGTLIAGPLSTTNIRNHICTYIESACTYKMWV